MTPAAECFADFLAAARRAGRQIDEQLAPKTVPVDAATAYDVADAVAARLGWEPLGWKIAGTSEDVRRRLGISGPIRGRTFRRFALSSPARLPHSELLDPLVECEFFVTLAKDLPFRLEPFAMGDIRAAIDHVAAGIEVAECRFPMRALPPLPAILADGSASGRYVFGDAIEDWQNGLASMEVVLEVDGALRRRGAGTDVMGDPLRPILWLTEALRRRGLGLAAGEMISTGSCTGMLPIRTGQRVRAVFGGKAQVEITFDE
ncbi:MAG: hypothetical protein K5Q68_19570 [Roseococcus sp.]|nr:hypothetical protein [Roseococcus sp.]